MPQPGKRKRKRKMSRNKGASPHIPPRDERRRGAHVRAWFAFQDQCIAYAALQHLRRGELEGLLPEHSTDLVLVPTSGPSVLVSIKHREPHQRSGEAGWSWTALQKAGVLRELYAWWVKADRRCGVAFYSNAGLVGGATALLRGDNNAAVIKQLTMALGIEEADAAGFLAALQLPRDTFPGRTHIRANAVREVEDFLVENGRSRLAGDAAYEALLARIAQASTEDGSARHAEATVRLLKGEAAEAALGEHYIAADEVRGILLGAADGHNDHGAQRWEPDPLFRGRENELRRLTELLRPGKPDPVAPVVLSGMPGCGKTALALEFAARQAGVLVPTRIDASSPLRLAAALAELADHLEPARPTHVPSSSTPLEGAAGPSIPRSSRTLLILDGVSDRGTVAAVTRRQLCRVIITTTVPDLDAGFEEITVGEWEHADAVAYVRTILPEFGAADADALVRGLHHQALAIVQSANLCRQLGWTVTTLLETLATTPVLPLDAGEARGHAGKTLAASIRVAIQVARERGTPALDLLAAITLLGPQGVPESVLARFGVAMPLDGADMLEAPGGDAPASTEAPRDGVVASVAGHLHPRTAEVIDNVAGAETRVPATLLLRDLALVTVDGGTYTVHPLVAHIVLRELGGLRPWLEATIGSFGEYFAGLQAGDEPAPLSDSLADIPAMARLVDLCLEHDFGSQPLFTLVHFLAVYVAALGDHERSLRYSETATAWAQRLPDTDFGAAMRFYTAREHAELLLYSGDAEGAAATFERLLEEAEAQDARMPAVDIVMRYSYAASALQDHERMRRCLRILMAKGLLDELPPDARVRARLARANLLWRLDQPHGVRVQLRKAMQEAAALEDRDLRLTVMTLAAGYGDDFGFDATKLYPEVLELTRQLYGPESETYVRALASAAQADIQKEYRTFDHAQQRALLGHAAPRLDEAEEILRRALPDSREVASTVMATRGRLLLHQAMLGADTLPQAERVLRETVGLLRALPLAHRGNLPSTLVNLARALELMARTEPAITAAREAYELDLARYGSAHYETMEDLRILNRLRRARASR